MNSLQSEFNYYQSLYTSIGYTWPYADIYEYTKMDWKALEESILTSAQASVAVACAYQYIYEELGLTITTEEYEKYVLEIGSYKTVAEFEAAYSKAYGMQCLLQKKVVEALADKATIEK